MKEDFKVYREHKIPEFLSHSLIDKDLIRRILFTLFIIFIVKLVFLIPAPGVNVGALMDFYNKVNIRHGYRTSSIFFSGSIGRFSLFSLGLMPYISSCLLLQIIGALCPPLRKNFFDGGRGRRKIVIYTYILTVLLSLFQAFFICMWLERPENFGGINVAYFSGWSFRIMITASLTCGVVFLIWLGSLITERGIGNGIPVLILASVVSVIPINISRIAHLLSEGYITGFSILVKLFLYTGLFVFIIFITKSSIKIPILFKETINKKMEYIHFRFSMVAKVPLAFASSLLLFPATLGGFSPRNMILQKISLILSPWNWIYIILYSILILFFTFVYMAIVFQPKYIINGFKKYKATISGSDVDKKELQYLDRIAIRVCLITGISLVVVAVFQKVISTMFHWPGSLYVMGGSLRFMIMVGVIYDIMRQIKARAKMKQYPGVKKQMWKCVYVALDEIEADIRKGFLANNNIPCVVEPLGFTWGLPIRTAVDQFRLYVPNSQYEEANKYIHNHSCPN